jgi:hypothetical protein
VNPYPPEPTTILFSVNVGLGDNPQQIPLSNTPDAEVVNLTIPVPELGPEITVSSTSVGAVG